MQEPLFVQSNLFQLMGQFLKIIGHLLSPQLLTHKLLNTQLHAFEVHISNRHIIKNNPIKLVARFIKRDIKTHF